jgi:hypothetical protein
MFLLIGYQFSVIGFQLALGYQHSADSSTPQAMSAVRLIISLTAKTVPKM